MNKEVELEKQRVVKIIKAALKEDIGACDITTHSLIDKFESAKAGIFTRDDCVVCGVDIASWVIEALDYSVRIKPTVKDGDPVGAGKEIIMLEGRARSILASERTMLNFLSFLSGIATKTREFVDIAASHGVKIYDTRKTYPLLRYLEKYAVSVGGGYNHRMGLYDQVLIKDNHLKVVKAKTRISDSIKDARGTVQKNIKVEIEVNTIDSFKEALQAAPDIIMLDNMLPEDIENAVRFRNEKNKKILLEASGGINLENIKDYAETGVDMISIGELTDSVKSIDMSLDIL